MAQINIGSLFGSSNSYSSLFGGTSSGGEVDSSYSMLSDYASIKNGSMAKLAKSYYGNSSARSASVDQESSDVAKETIKKNAALKNDTSDLRSTLSNIRDSKSLFTDKIEKKDDNGNVSSDYDRSMIYNKLNEFVKDYNDVLDKGAKSDNQSILRNTLGMTRVSMANRNMLDKVGITIGEDNKLSISESKVKEADISDLKSLFSGYGSYADVVDSKAQQIISNVEYENNKLSTYTAQGGYNSISAIGSIYDGTY